MTMSGQRLNQRSGRIAAWSTCIAYHGSDEFFAEFDSEKSTYADGMLCLSVSPLVAACYGQNIYVCIIREAKLLTVSVAQWFDTPDEIIEHWNAANLDGLLVEPVQPPFDDVVDATFGAHMVALWNVPKCRIVTHLCQKQASNFDVAAEFFQMREIKKSIPGIRERGPSPLLLGCSDFLSQDIRFFE